MNKSIRFVLLSILALLGAISAADPVFQQVVPAGHVAMPAETSGDGSLFTVYVRWSADISGATTDAQLAEMLDTTHYKAAFKHAGLEIGLSILGTRVVEGTSRKVIALIFEIPKDILNRLDEIPLSEEPFEFQVGKLDAIGNNPVTGRSGLQNLETLNQPRTQSDAGLSSTSEAFLLNASFKWTSKFADSRLFGGTTFQRFSADLRLPIGTPQDVDDDGVSGNADASRKVADRAAAAYQFRIGGRFGVTGIGANYRQTGSGKGRETVLSLFHDWIAEPAAGGFRLAFEAEAGARSGDAEWKSASEKANPGKRVQRYGAVAEWAPRLGRINANLGEGLRFFVRGRVWRDKAKNDSGDSRWRTRTFVDSELFLNLSDSKRIFLRYEEGWLPPDFGRRVRSVALGVGAAF